jgi:ribosomal protein L21
MSHWRLAKDATFEVESDVVRRDRKGKIRAWKFKKKKKNQTQQFKDGGIGQRTWV